MCKRFYSIIWEKYFNIVTWCGSWKSNIQLAMSKHRDVQVQANISYRLTLSLFMLSAKASCTGNCHLLNRKVTSTDEADGISAISLSCSPPINHTSKTLSCICITTMWVPLHRPQEGARFWRRMIGQPIFKLSSPGGRLDEWTEWRNSLGMGSLSRGSAPASCIISSALTYIWEFFDLCYLHLHCEVQESSNSKNSQVVVVVLSQC